jgi:hypothetical protein
MTPTETYLERLRAELASRFVADPRVLDEVRGHLLDDIDASCARGVPPAKAAAEAIERFGPPDVIAAAFAADRMNGRHRVLLVAAVAVGLLIAWVDARPHWDDTGITASLLVLAATVLGFLGPQRPWRWALALGLWIPAHAIMRTPSFGTMPLLLVLLLPVAGAYVGRVTRRAMAQRVSLGATR